MQEEIDSVKRNQTWELTDLPQGHRAITLKWVYKLKQNEIGEIVKHKARLVARGFVQQEGIYFDEVFALIARMEYVRLLLVLAAQEGWQVHHIDVKSMFLNGDLKMKVYCVNRRNLSSPTKKKDFKIKECVVRSRVSSLRSWNSNYISCPISLLSPNIYRCPKVFTLSGTLQQSGHAASCAVE
jgi:hypothetical protein